MKNSYIRLLISNTILLLITILNGFYNFFNSYTFILFLLIFLIFIYKFIGYERNNKRFQKDSIIQILIVSISFYIVTYLLGLFTGFNKTGYSLKFTAVFMHVFPIIITIPLIEIIRYILVNKSLFYKSISLLLVINFVMIDLTLLINSYSYGIIYFFLLLIIPSISKNILLMYLNYKIGYKPAILYRIIFETSVYILPIFPAFGLYLESIINFLFPLFFIYVINFIFFKNSREEIIAKKKNNYVHKIGIVLTTVVILIIVVLTTGYFKYFAVTIGSNSMVPKINKGDIVIVEKLNENEMKNIKKQDILVFRHDNIIIVHRVINIIEVSGINYYYTKGDNNATADGYPIDKSDIIGIYATKIPYLGQITVEISELINK